MSLPYFRMYPTDYEGKTAHLSLLEDGAYNRLLRLCWSMPNCEIPDDDAWIMRRMRARTEEEQKAVLTVLAEYFVRENRVVSQKRIKEEFEHAKNRYDAARENGSKGGRKPNTLKNNKTDESNGFPSGSDPLKLNKANQNQNQNHNKRAKDRACDGFETFWQACPRKVAKGTAEKAYAKAMTIAEAEDVLQGMVRYAASMKGKDAQYIAHPATWLNARRWLDDAPKAEPKRGDIIKVGEVWKRFEDWPLGWCELHPEQVKRMGLQ